MEISLQIGNGNVEIGGIILGGIKIILKHPII
jgi:hypothetical protein